MKTFQILLVLIYMNSLPFWSIAQIKGTYINITEPYKEIFFDQETFVFRYNNYQKVLPLYYCNDTIAYGHWKKVKDPNQRLIELSSEDFQLNSLSNITVNERKDDKVQGLNFIISNPIEIDQKQFNRDNRAIEYGIEIKSNCVEYQGSLVNRKFNSDEFSVQIPKNCFVTSFSIYVYPVDFLKGWQLQFPSVIHSFLYDIKEQESNTFEINLPDLTYCFVNSIKLKQDYILIEKDELLKWNGEYYKKK